MQKRKLPSFVSLLILTFITVVMWVAFEVYRAYNKVAAPSVPVNVSAPLVPTLDMETLSEIETKLFLHDSEIPDVVINFNLPTAPQFTETETVPESPDSSPLPESENASGSGESE